MVDDSVVVGVHILEEGRDSLDLLAVLPEHVLEREVFEISGGNVAFLHVFLLDSAEDEVDHFSLVPADQQDLLWFVNGDECDWLFPFEFASRLPDYLLGFLQCVHELLLQLVSKDLAKGCYLGIVLAVFLDAVDNAHGPLNSHWLESIFLVEISIHVSLKGFHWDVGLLADDVVLGLWDIDFVDEFFELVESECFVELDVDVDLWGVFCLAFAWRFGLLSFDNIADGGLKHIALAVLGDLVKQLCILGLEGTYLVEMILLDSLQPLYLVLEQLFLLYHNLCNLWFASICTRLKDVRHRLEWFCDVVVYSFNDGGDALVEVVEISDKLNEAEVNESVLAADDATVYLFLSWSSW